MGRAFGCRGVPPIACGLQGSQRNASANASDGDRARGVRRGRRLRDRAMAMSCCAEYKDSSALLGEVLAQQAVGVLVGAALPGALGVAEVDLDTGVHVKRTCSAISLP